MAVCVVLKSANSDTYLAPVRGDPDPTVIMGLMWFWMGFALTLGGPLLGF